MHASASLGNVAEHVSVPYGRAREHVHVLLEQVLRTQVCTEAAQRAETAG